MNTFTTRLGAALLMIALLTWGYWWMMLAAALFFLFVFHSYYEILLWGIIFDALYAIPTQGSFDYRLHIGAFIAIVVFFASIFLKKRLSFYS